MRLSDFMANFNLLTVCRPLDLSWYEVVYQESFFPSKGALSAKSQEWLQNKQYVFTLNNPDVNSIRVNVTLEQTDMRMTDTNESPSYSGKRIKIGLVIIEMSKAQDEITHFEAKKLIKSIKPQGVRHITASF